MQRRSGQPLTIPLTIEIHDSIVDTTHDGGEYDSYEKKTMRSPWDGNGKDESVSAVLKIDEVGKLYSLQFGVLPQQTTKPVDMLVKQDIERSKYGYGRARTHASKTLRKEKVPFSAILIPQIRGVLAGGHVQHAKRKLEVTNDSFAFTDTFPVPESYMAGLPEVSKNQVRVHYRLTRITLD